MSDNVYALTGDTADEPDDDIIGRPTSIRIPTGPLLPSQYQPLNGGPYPYPRHSKHAKPSSSSSDTIDVIDLDSTLQKVFVDDLMSEVRKIRNAQRVTAVSTFVGTICMVLIVVALYQDSQTLDKMAKQGTEIMTTVQAILAEFQSTNVLRTVHEVSNTWTDKYSSVATRVALTIANTVNVVDDVIQQVIRGNTTALIREGLYEASLFIDTANHVLERLSVVFNISPHALENITAGV